MFVHGVSTPVKHTTAAYGTTESKQSKTNHVTLSRFKLHSNCPMTHADAFTFHFTFTLQKSVSRYKSQCIVIQDMQTAELKYSAAYCHRHTAESTKHSRNLISSENMSNTNNIFLPCALH